MRKRSAFLIAAFVGVVSAVLAVLGDRAQANLLDNWIDGWNGR